ncbi:MAG: hypothetical protein ACI8ZB_000896 [Desulforhopalus sp.]|jgi:hypothetical protein
MSLCMKRLIIIILLSAITWPCNLVASELMKVARVDNKDILQIYLSFDKPPTFSGTATKRRIDIKLESTVLASDLKLIQPDENVVKFLTRHEKNDIILSLFFRYQPQNFKLTPNANNSIVLEVLLGNEYSKSYKNLADKLKGLTIVDRATPDFTNPYILSPYKSDWTSFFSNYESPVHIDIPVTFTPPPFPLIGLLPPGRSTNLDLLTSDMMELAENGSWDALATTLLEKLQATTGTEAQKMLALTYGEALMRDGSFDGAFKQLYLLKEKYKEERLGTYASYLLIWLRANYEDPYIAEYEYRALTPSISDKSPLAPYFLLSRIETSLATKEYKNLNKLLQVESIALPPEVEEKLKIRQADYWYAIDDPIKAYAAYKLLKNSPVLRTQPYSYGGYTSTLYDQRYFESAAQEYKNLQSIVQGDNVVGSVAYRENMAKLKFTPGDELIDDFSQIENTHSDTDAGLLAAIKKTDLRLLKDKQWSDKALENYQDIASRASSRLIREEAEFKSILIHALTGNNKTAVPLLHKFLRDFQTSNVRITAQALLIELLPKEINRLVEETDYIKALVLAKKNKDLFQKNWIDSNFLVDIAEAYHKIGIYDEAQKLYLYLIEIMSADQREKYYLPMIQATFDHGNFSLVEDYSAQYTYNYPKGVYLKEILLLRLQSLIADERLSVALQTLPIELPDDYSYHPLASTLYFRTDNYLKTIATLEEYLNHTQTLDQQQYFFLAESYYRTNDLTLSVDTFLKVSKENRFYQQSLYRLAEIHRQLGKGDLALSFLQKIVETEENTRWKQYAERDLQYESQKDRY